eukprot:2110496-Amphidinium_carterae.2
MGVWSSAFLRDGRIVFVHKEDNPFVGTIPADSINDIFQCATNIPLHRLDIFSHSIGHTLVELQEHHWQLLFQQLLALIRL